MKSITAIIPVKGVSERLENKNFREINGRPLYEYVLTTLQHCKMINKVIVNTDCPEKIKIDHSQLPKVEIQKRPESLLGHQITGSDISNYVIANTEGEHFLQTHVTNPLLTINTIEKAINFYFDNLPEYDSLFSVDRILKRLYTKDGSPVNHKLTESLQTQYLEPIFAENSSMFIFSRQSFTENGNNRLGRKPYMFVMNSIESIDIDYYEDFLLASLICENKHRFKDIFNG